MPAVPSIDTSPACPQAVQTNGSKSCFAYCLLADHSTLCAITTINIVVITLSNVTVIISAAITHCDYHYHCIGVTIIMSVTITATITATSTATIVLL